MEWIMNAIANAIIEALNDMLRWTANLITGFNLEVWDASSEFGKTFGGVSIFMHSIQVLAMFIVIMASVLKLYQSMGGPFTQSEEPGVIAIRTIFAGCGVILAYRIFALITKGFNSIYSLFVAQYTGMTEEFQKGSWFPSPEEVAKTKQIREAAKEKLSGSQYSVGQFDLSVGGNSPGNNTGMGSSSDAFNLFGGEKLIENGYEASLGLIIIEAVIGCTLMICFFKLVLECYERYVLIGIMYYTAPFAFATLVSKQSQIFKNWCQMLVSQFILMCMNLFFLGGFIAAWYRIIERGVSDNFLFPDSKTYLTTMFIMIGWLLAGQKMDEHLRGLGLSAATTGSGIMGAMMGGAALAAGTFRAVNGAARGTARLAQKGIGLATGGKVAATSSRNPGIFDNTKVAQNGGDGGDNGKERQLSDRSDRKEAGGGEHTARPLEQNGLPQPTDGKSGEALQNTAEANKAIADQVANIGGGANSKFGADFDAESARVTSHEAVPGGQGHRSIMEDGNGRQAYIYDNVADAKMVHGSYTNKQGLDVPNYAEVKVGTSDGAIHFKPTNKEPAKA